MSVTILIMVLYSIKVFFKGPYMNNEKSATALAEELGERLKQARLNHDLTQAAVARRAGISRKTMVQAEKGKAQLEIFIAILLALDMAKHLDNLLPKQTISPLQLAKLQGKIRRRASGQHKGSQSAADTGADTTEW